MKLQTVLDAIEALECANEADIESRMLTKNEFMKVLRAKSALKGELAAMNISIPILKEAA